MLRKKIITGLIGACLQRNEIKTKLNDGRTICEKLNERNRKLLSLLVDDSGTQNYTGAELYHRLTMTGGVNDEWVETAQTLLNQQEKEDGHH